MARLLTCWKKTLEFATFWAHKIHTAKNGGGTVMLWGSYSLAGRGKLIRLDKIKCSAILKEKTPQTKQKDMKLRQDHNLQNVSEAIVDWFRSKHIYD